MAFASKSRALAAQISAGARRAPLASRRGLHVPGYEKNPDDVPVQPKVVPEHMIEAESNKYWAPDPETGVFRPVEQTSNNGSTASSFRPPSASNADGASALDQQAWFRPLEEVDKPPPP